MAQKALWNLARENMLQDGGALPEEECDVIGEYTAMHKEKFLAVGSGRTERTRKEECAQKEKLKKKWARRGVRRERDGEC